MARPRAPVGAPKTKPDTEDRRRRLEARRDEIEARLPDASHRDFAALVSQYRAILGELSDLPEVKEASAVDEIAARRARRRSTATRSKRSAGGDVSG